MRDVRFCAAQRGAVGWILGIVWELPALKAAVRRLYLMAAVAILLWQVATKKAPEDQILRFGVSIELFSPLLVSFNHSRNPFSRS